MQFADTFYFLALLNVKDVAHTAAHAYGNQPGRILTTGWVLTELADAMATRAKRQIFVDFHRLLQFDPDVEVVPSSAALFDNGMSLYASRPDKDWSLTDCISFAVMQERGITEALTGDHHFEQAGFQALLK
jgi:predicted nucleic acid-binding protein